MITAKEKKYLAALEIIQQAPSLETIVITLHDQLVFFWVGFYFVKENYLELGPFH